MPEYPDVELYLHALRPRILGHALAAVRVGSPFVVRSIDPPMAACVGRRVSGLRRLGKRLVWELEDELFVVIHLMIAGRLRWTRPGTKLPGKGGLTAFDFEHGTLILTEAGSQHRAAIHVVRGPALAEHDPGGLEIVEADAAAFDRQLRRENHTLKRALTDPRLFAGIGNAYSDEILLAAGLSPLQMTSRLEPHEAQRLFEAARRVLLEWRDRLIAECGSAFPGKVTAFRSGMAVHGRYGKPCPRCGTPIQRIRYANSEANYCATCQTGGRLLADRALSRLLREDWPRSLDELERRKDARKP